MTDSRLPSQEQTGLTPGAQLRMAREAAGLSHAAISEALHLTVHYIKSLENDEYHKLPGVIFVKGYIRSYARYLKLDPEPLLASCDRQVSNMPEIKSQTLAGNYTRKRNDQAIGWAIAATLVILLGIGIGWWFFGRSDEPTRTTVPVTLTPTPVAPAASTTDEARTADAGDGSSTDAGSDQNTAPATVEPQAAPADAAAAATPPAATPQPATSPSPASVTPAASGGRQINLVHDGSDQMQLSLGGNSWVEINDGQNARLYAEMLHTGDNLVLKGKAPFQVLLGNARNVKVSFNATPVDISTSIRTDSTARLMLGAVQTSGVVR